MNATQQLHAHGQSLWFNKCICALKASATPVRFIDESHNSVATTSGAERWLGRALNSMGEFIVATDVFTLPTKCRSGSLWAARCTHAT